jgi:hypothetical protein
VDGRHRRAEATPFFDGEQRTGRTEGGMAGMGNP